jgi:hypothetical protein
MTEYKTMRVPVDAWEDAKEAKEEKETWGEYLQRCSNSEPISVEGGSTFDWETFDLKLQQHLGEWELTLNMDQFNGQDGLDENDVRNLVEGELEMRFGDRLPSK